MHRGDSAHHRCTSAALRQRPASTPRKACAAQELRAIRRDRPCVPVVQNLHHFALLHRGDGVSASAQSLENLPPLASDSFHVCASPSFPALHFPSSPPVASLSLRPNDQTTD